MESSIFGSATALDKDGLLLKSRSTSHSLLQNSTYSYSISSSSHCIEHTILCYEYLPRDYLLHLPCCLDVSCVGCIGTDYPFLYKFNQTSNFISTFLFHYDPHHLQRYHSSAADPAADPNLGECNPRVAVLQPPSQTIL